MARKFTYNEKQSGDSTQAKKGKDFHCTADNLRPAIIVIREVKTRFLTSRQFISTLLTCSDDRKLSLWYVIRYRISLQSDKDAGEGDLGLCFP